IIFDEAQRAPELFSYIQTRVDKQDLPGQFVLTGSQNFILLDKISQSLAGRCALAHLLPLAHCELRNRPPVNPDSLGVRLPEGKSSSQKKADLYSLLWTGFYPRIHDKHLPPQDWLANYCQTYLERDVREITQVGDLESFGRFLRLCAGRVGQLLNLVSLGEDCGISNTTARRWLSVLETSFIVYQLRPHFQNYRKRLIKSPKLYFVDTGLLCYLLRIQNSGDLSSHAMCGAVFENYVVSELLKNYYNRGLEPPLYFWRDSTGHELDIVLDRGSSPLPIEIKSGQTVASDSFKGIDFWREMTGQANAPAALIYGGDESYKQRNAIVYSWMDI
ncbi:MAG: DUF4143 domain-containing protein, partial [Candidatus Sumerlaeota bacterium]|nr:DUF4143 domain-containing protein [Candidatus Sumerlaeota bacterium]